MQGKIDEEELFNLSANFLPEYPVNGWPIFQGLFNTFYSALDDLCEFKAPNVLQCGVGRRVKDILRALKRYLSRMGLITWSPEQLQSWFETRGKKQELGKSQKIHGKHDKTSKGQIQYTNKKRRQNETFSEAPGVKPKLETQAQQPIKGNFATMTQPSQGNNKVKKKDKEGQHGVPKNSSPTQPLVCGHCLRQYKNIRSYRTHMYQVHIKQVPDGSSHMLLGQPLVRAVPLKPNPSIRSDQPRQPRQDTLHIPSLGPIQRDSEMIEETPQGNIVHGRKAHTTVPGPPKGKKGRQK